MTRKTLDNFRFEYPKNSKIIAIVCESEEEVSVHIRPDCDFYNFIDRLNIPEASSKSELHSS